MRLLLTKLLDALRSVGSWFGLTKCTSRTSGKDLPCVNPIEQAPRNESVNPKSLQSIQEPERDGSSKTVGVQHGGQIQDSKVGSDLANRETSHADLQPVETTKDEDTASEFAVRSGKAGTGGIEPPLRPQN